jgi:hypothetical protein
MLRPQIQLRKIVRPRSNTFLMVSVLASAGLLAFLITGSARSVESKSGAFLGVETRGSAKRTSQRLGRRPNRLLGNEPGDIWAGSSFVAAAPPLVSVTVDRTDDTAAVAASLCTPAPNDCSLRGAIILANTVPGTTIILPAGTYQLTIDGSAETGFCFDATAGDLDISGNNTTISGAGASTTIIQQTMPNDRVLCVDANLDGNFTFNISGVTITGGRETFGVGGGGMVSGAAGDVTTVQDCIITGNQASGGGSPVGGGIANAGGSLNVSGTTLSSNTSSGGGGGVYFGGTPGAGTLSVSNSTFTNNTSTAGSGGGLLATQGSYTVTGSSFSGNNSQGTNGQGGGIFKESGTMTVGTSSFFNNHVTAATGKGGGIANSNSGSLTANFNRIVGNTANTGSGASSGGGAFNANDNWWGCNSGPGGASGGGCAVSPNGTAGLGLSAITWLQLRHTASPSSICSGATSTLTADIKGRNIGSALTTELNGLPAFPVPPGTIFSNATLGTLSGASTQFVNGVATATYTAGGTSGAGSADATADNQTVTASISIQSNSTTDPADQAVCQGATASFSTTASGPGPFSYAWTLDGSPFNGDSPSINVPTGSLSLGPHTVAVTTTGACGSASQSATLTVQSPTATTDPADATVCQGATANFSTTASGTGPFSYAWTLDGSPFNGDSPSINVPTGSLSVGPHTVAVTTTGACGSASQSATLTVQSPTATTDPADVAVCQGATASFSTTASGTGPFHYAWTLDGSPFNGDSASINVPTGSLSVGPHTVAVTTTGACGSASQSATLTVQPPTATSDPPDQTVCKGATASFSTTASGTGPFHYAWTLDGSPFNGDSASINVPTGSLSVGPHTVAVTTTGACGSASQSATLTVQPPTATSDPADQTVCKGATANFSTTASGTGPFHYAWTLDGSPFNGDSSSINVPTGSLSSGPHTVAVTTTGTCGSASQSATLTVGSPPVITLSTNNINMWPPNHNYHTFTASDFGASASGCDGNLTSSVEIASVSSDELEDNPGGADGSTLNDIVIAANCKSVQLRIERDANLNGRVYTITFRVRDSQGNTTTATATVSVPINQGGGAAVNGPGPGYTVTSACP